MTEITEMAQPSFRRDNRSLLQTLERPTLRWFAASMPAWVRPDMLTGIGLLGAVIAAVGYAFAANHPALLWLASLGIVINWFGDSLDGSLARARGIERPIYGFFIDNTTDVLEYGLFAIGFGLSGYLPWRLVMAALAAFYMVMLLGLIKARALNVFQISFGGVGLTEVRCGFILVNAAMYFVPPQPFSMGLLDVTYPQLIAAFWISVQVATFVIGAIRALRELAALEPPRYTREDTAYLPVDETGRPTATGS